MKKYVLQILLGIILLNGINVYAANYNMKELIPVDTKTTIVSKNFSYKKFYYAKNTNLDEKDGNTNYIIFTGIKNISNNDLPISISIALFDQNKKNIGTINYCSKDNVLSSKEERTYSIKVENDYLQEEKSSNDVKYISVLSDNKNCTTGGSKDFIGKTINEIGQIKNTELDSDSKLFISIIAIVVGIIIITFLYNFLFTNSFNNMDGEDTRKGFAYKNRKLKEQREKELIKNPPLPKKKKEEKAIEIINSEEQEANKPEESSSLHNLYK